MLTQFWLELLKKLVLSYMEPTLGWNKDYMITLNNKESTAVFVLVVGGIKSETPNELCNYDFFLLRESAIQMFLLSWQNNVR